jgi:hypothetical protein
MSFTYDPATEIGKVRMLIPDRDSQHYVFQDEEIQVFLELNASSLRCAAAEALETIASDTAMVLKVISILDLTTNGAATANALMARAATLRASADQSEEEEEALFDWAETTETVFQQRERLWKQGLRSR